MAIKILPASKVRQSLPRIFDELSKTHEFLTITKNGQAQAVLVDIDDFNQILERLEELDDIQAALEVKDEKEIGLKSYLAQRKRHK